MEELESCKSYKKKYYIIGKNQQLPIPDGYWKLFFVKCVAETSLETKERNMMFYMLYKLP